MDKLVQEVDPLIGVEPELLPPTAGEVEPPPNAPGGQPPVAEPPSDTPPVMGGPTPDVDEGEGEGEEGEGQEAALVEGQAPRRGKRRPSWTQLHEVEEKARTQEARVADLERRLAEHQQATMAAQQALGGQQGQVPQGVPGVDRPYTQVEMQQLQQYDPTEYARVTSEMSMRQSQATQQQIELMRTQMVIREQINDFRKTATDYDDAVKHLETRELARLRAAGIPENMVQPMLEARAGMLIQAALQQGKPVPMLAYEVAKADGWVSPSAQAAVVASDAAVASVAQTPAQKVAASKAKSLAAAGSIGTIPGTAAGKATFSRDDVMGMSEAEMDRLDKESPGWQEQISP